MPGDNGAVRFGLRESTIVRLQEVFARYPEIEQGILYGSRAKGTFRPGSDIDLTLKGDSITLALCLKVSIDLDDLLLPYKVDLSIWQMIDNPHLREHIDRVGIKFYSRSEPHSPSAV